MLGCFVPRRNGPDPLPRRKSQLGVLESAFVGLMTVFSAFSVFAGAVLRASGRMVAGILAELGIAPWISVILIGVPALFLDTSLLTVLCSLLAAGVVTSVWAFSATRTFFDVSEKMDWRGCVHFVRNQLTSLASLMGTSLLFFVLVWVPQLGLGVLPHGGTGGRGHRSREGGQFYQHLPRNTVLVHGTEACAPCPCRPDEAAEQRLWRGGLDGSPGGGARAGRGSRRIRIRPAALRRRL